MMWKESYRLGVDNIDEQHKKLFETAGALVREIEGEQRPEVYKQIIDFLQEYVIFHFRDEEAYFSSLGYTDEAKHKKQHHDLSQEVEKHASLVKASDYAPHFIKKLAGMLTAWLIYHVLNEDLKYLGKIKESTMPSDASYIDHFANSVIQVLETMIDLNPAEVTKMNSAEAAEPAALCIEIGLIGDLQGSVVFGFAQDFAFNLVKAMMSYSPTEIDELVCSALAEISNISSGNGTISISKTGVACDIRPPQILEDGVDTTLSHEELTLNTPIGQLKVFVYLN